MDKINRLETLYNYLRNQPPDEHNPVNTLQDIEHWYFIVCTFPKCGTTSVATSLQKAIDGRACYTNVIHCHSETCWRYYIFRDDTYPFEISDLITLCNLHQIKPIVFQLYREPVSRHISDFFCQYDMGHLHSLDIVTFLTFLLTTNYEDAERKAHYEHCFGIDFSNQTLFHHTKGYGWIDHPSHYVYLTSIDRLDRMGNNLYEQFKHYNPFPIQFQTLSMEIQNAYHSSPEKDAFRETLWIPQCFIHDMFASEQSLLSFYYSSETIHQLKQQYFDPHCTLRVISDEDACQRIELLRPDRVLQTRLPHWTADCYLYYLLADHIPSSFDDRVYTQLHPDLQHLSTSEILVYYERVGRFSTPN